MALCYKDRWYCSSKCSNAECDRNATDEIVNAAKVFGLPIAYSPVDDCDKFMEPFK